MRINAIAAIGDQNQLALNNELPWHYPEDLKLFKEKVKNKTVILGRKTYESMPPSFFQTVTPIVVTTAIDDYELAASSLEDAIDLASDLDLDEVWICGGVSIYKEALEKKLINTLHISHIPYDGPADRYFPNFMPMVDGVSHGETIHSPSNNKSFRYKAYEMERKARQPGELLDFTGSFLRPVVRSGFASTEIDMSHPAAQLTVTSSNIGLDLSPAYSLSGTTVQNALEELSMGMHFIPTDAELTTPGQTRFNPITGLMEVMSSDGVVHFVGDMESNVRTTSSAREAIRDVIQGELNRYVDSRMPASELSGINSTLKDRINTAIKEYDPNSDIAIEIVLTTSRNTSPIYVVGSYEPIEFGNETSQYVNITLSGFFMGRFINNVNFEINF